MTVTDVSHAQKQPLDSYKQDRETYYSTLLMAKSALFKWLPEQFGPRATMVAVLAYSGKNYEMWKNLSQSNNRLSFLFNPLLTLGVTYVLPELSPNALKVCALVRFLGAAAYSQQKIKVYWVNKKTNREFCSKALFTLFNLLPELILANTLFKVANKKLEFQAQQEEADKRWEEADKRWNEKTKRWEEESKRWREKFEQWIKCLEEKEPREWYQCPFFSDWSSGHSSSSYEQNRGRSSSSDESKYFNRFEKWSADCSELKPGWEKATDIAKLSDYGLNPPSLCDSIKALQVTVDPTCEEAFKTNGLTSKVTEACSSFCEKVKGMYKTISLKVHPDKHGSSMKKAATIATQYLNNFRDTLAKTYHCKRG